MTKRMLIDATHPEEIRVAVVDSHNRIEEFDFETATKKSLKGNIYLAKITRVEPSLQAAFIEYGGNRNGFLSFTEIHPDYFRIPVDDRQKLEEKILEEKTENLIAAETPPDAGPDSSTPEAASDQPEMPENQPAVSSPIDGPVLNESQRSSSGPSDDGIETLEGDELDDEHNTPPRPSYQRRYKIQEVIQRNQILLVQVTKEERGGKGAALTTYLSLAGRYCVLMPNSPRSGGISRRISSVGDRKRLRSIIDELNLPDGMSLIVRTAGKERSKIEVKRDAEYLFRTWDNIRELTIQSTAPALTYEEASLIKRSIRDIYDKDIREILVEGEEAYKGAKNFMKDLIPSHSKKVQRYVNPAVPMFHAFKIEPQIDEIHKPVVQLPSGGYLVINPTEALVSIDINSGRSTRERHIEETALRTNLEAADEIARQLRLRDLAGLVVIDFIDMDDQRHKAAVERRLKDAMQRDRARIQIGTISLFGLLEMSRQRLRPSILESSTVTCHYCQGSGLMRSKESSALEVLRALEEEAPLSKSKALTVAVPLDVGLYILNQKRTKLIDIEMRHKIEVSIRIKDALIPPQFEILCDGDLIKAPAAAQPHKKQPVRSPSRPHMPSRNAAPQPAAIDVPHGSTSPPPPHTFGSDADKIHGPAAVGENIQRTRRRGRRGGRHRNRHSQPRLNTGDVSSDVQTNGTLDPSQPLPRAAHEDMHPANASPRSPPKGAQEPHEKTSSKQKPWWQRILD